MKIIKSIPLGYEVLTNTTTSDIIHQLRFACIVKPCGDFISDPAGDITEIKLIDPISYKDYFDWGKRSDAMLAKAIKLLHIL